MSYSAFIRYANGGKSHRLMTSSRADVELHLGMILGEEEVLTLAESIVILYSGREILNAPASTPLERINELIQWPCCGAPVKVSKPVAATIYMPEKVRDWLSELGDGKVSRGLRKLVESAEVPELDKAWLR
ncbi:hypothetical protein ACSI5N_25410 (plasmid) [Raoultella ornithinolytica]|uniref:hypothetical protein n=1 Tax=Raoultella ornithinolytica TaxID=54291 RepID=UPI00292BEBA2|nr:hypothetical protein [Raoultella ornithinolytica]MDV1094964.1 hypothetical protein [Raoultella ornithinolytica]MDV1122692.1 hypothetical protein [Raoultella ornithinolytica]MDV1893207.1 hypothetical protein [Raoultella ornithinolytica]